MKSYSEQILTGIGLTFAASVLVPLLKSATSPAFTYRPVGLLTAKSELQQRLSSVGARTKEELEDFLAEVEFERFKRKIDVEVGSDRRHL